MFMFSGKKGFKIRCLIAVLFFVMSLLTIRLALPYLELGVVTLEPQTNNGFLLASVYFMVFPVLLFVSSSIILGSKIKESILKFFKFTLTSTLVFLALAILLLDYKSSQINTSMVLDILRKFDKPAKEVVFPHMETLTNISYVSLYYFMALLAGLAMLNFWNFASLAKKVSRDAGALYDAIPDEQRN